MGGNLGYDVLFVLDAAHTFDRAGPDGEMVTADELARATATSIHGEFATVVKTADLPRRRSVGCADAELRVHHRRPDPRLPRVARRGSWTARSSRSA